MCRRSSISWGIRQKLNVISPPKSGNYSNISLINSVYARNRSRTLCYVPERAGLALQPCVPPEPPGASRVEWLLGAVPPARLGVLLDSYRILISTGSRPSARFPSDHRSHHTITEPSGRRTVLRTEPYTLETAFPPLPAPHLPPPAAARTRAHSSLLYTPRILAERHLPPGRRGSSAAPPRRLVGRQTGTAAESQREPRPGRPGAAFT